ncbi:MAG: electron transfer flavoprotein subunit beta/FixA family protein [Deltaproteobacteria bacterium]|uniref:Electron transfer flavoprotein small subunit n=1 Tax=Candidatus Zymogenus saltonus TaxID=2844893 RepID=A0A9D8KE13_9DELT|nr:electron transfer flavoprotein subunit beta/FixA family protein [Candidatus Zymogenus saltonus]
MNSAVIMKQVPDTEALIKLAPDGSGYVKEGVKFVMNPYDEFGVEEALKIKEAAGAGEVTIISLGSERAVEAIRTALAMGADKGVLLNAGEGSACALGLAKALAEELKAGDYKIIFCGKQAIDDDMAQVGPMVAELMGIPCVTVVTKVELSGNKAVCTREIEGGKEIVEVALPAVIACQKGLNEPRYASLPGIMKAKKKPLDQKDISLGDAKAVIVKWEAPPERPPGRIIEGDDAATKAAALVKALREEAKVI